MRIRCSADACPPPMTFTLGLLVVVNGLIIPLTGYAHPLVGAISGWITVVVALVIGWNLASRSSSSSSSSYPLLRVLDLYLFTCLAMAIVWYTMWALDGSTSRSEQVSVPVEPDASHFFAYLVISYNVVGSFWLIGPARMFPVSISAYVWGFAVLIVGIWRVFAVLSLIVRLTSPTGVSSSPYSQQQQQQEEQMESGQSEFASIHHIQQQQSVQPIQQPYGLTLPSPVFPVAASAYRSKGLVGPSAPLHMPPPPMSIATLRHLQEMSKAAKAANNLAMTATFAQQQQQQHTVVTGVSKPKDA